MEEAMSINRELVSALAEKYDSFYLYDEKIIEERINVLKSAFEKVRFLYSVKANPLPAVLNCIFSNGVGADAASLGEVLTAKEMGLKPDDIYYSAPGKSIKAIKAALGSCVIIADSVNEVEKINEASAQQGITANIGIRINPDFTFDGDEGAANKFGIDEKTVFESLAHWKMLDNIKIIGIHVHSRSQELNGRLIVDYYARMFELALRFQTALGEALHFVNMGSGIGIPYAKDDNEVDITYLGGEMSKLIDRYSDKLAGTQILIESGRYIAGKCGVYATKVVDIKQSYGKTFVLLSNTLNGFIRPSIACMVEGYTNEEKPNGCEPMYTGRGAFEITALSDSEETETVTLTGNLCTGTDVIAKDIELPKLKCGDVVVISNAGSYAAVLSPMQFASLEKPAQILVKSDGEIIEG